MHQVLWIGRLNTTVKPTINTANALTAKINGNGAEVSNTSGLDYKFTWWKTDKKLLTSSSKPSNSLSFHWPPSSHPFGLKKHLSRLCQLSKALQSIPLNHQADWFQSQQFSSNLCFFLLFSQQANTSLCSVSSCPCLLSLLCGSVSVLAHAGLCCARPCVHSCKPRQRYRRTELSCNIRCKRSYPSDCTHWLSYLTLPHAPLSTASSQPLTAIYQTMHTSCTTYLSAFRFSKNLSRLI